MASNAEIADTPAQWLPTELTTAVFKNLDMRSLMRCHKVCVEWHKIVRDSMELQYQIELGVHELEDNFPRNTSIRDRLQVLRSSQRAWRLLNLGAPVPLSTLPEDYTFRTHRHANAVIENTVYWAIESGTDTIDLTCSDLRSSSRLDVAWTMPRRPGVLSESLFCAVDCQQDLVAIVTFLDGPVLRGCVYLRSLETGVAHISAGDAVLLFEGPEIPRPRQTVVDIVGSTLLRVSVICGTAPVGPTITDLKMRTFIWDWKTSILQMHTYHHTDSSLALVKEGFGIVSNPRIPTDREFALGFTAFDPKNQPVPSPAPGTALSDMVSTCTFLLPKKLPSWTTSPDFIDISIRRAIHHPSSLFLPHYDADGLLDVCSFKAGCAAFRWLISLSKLAALIKTYAQQDTGRVVPWAEWSECAVWVGHANDYYTSYRSALGMRFASADVTHQPSSVLRVLDLNPVRACRALAEGLYPGESAHRLSEMPAGHFDERVIARHPFLMQEVPMVGLLRHGWEWPKEVIMTPVALLLIYRNGDIAVSAFGNA